MQRIFLSKDKTIMILIWYYNKVQMRVYHTFITMNKKKLKNKN